VDWAILFGSIGLFLTLLFLFIRILPMISIFEMRTIVPSPKTRPSAAPSAAAAGD
jgi:molybdopterin-containing oxidoreductase family membrane subunit